jgi:hypothetical protein
MTQLPDLRKLRDHINSKPQHQLVLWLRQQAGQVLQDYVESGDRTMSQSMFEQEFLTSGEIIWERNILSYSDILRLGEGHAHHLQRVLTQGHAWVVGHFLNHAKAQPKFRSADAANHALSLLSDPLIPVTTKVFELLEAVEPSELVVASGLVMLLHPRDMLTVRDDSRSILERYGYLIQDAQQIIPLHDVRTVNGLVAAGTQIMREYGFEDLIEVDLTIQLASSTLRSRDEKPTRDISTSERRKLEPSPSLWVIRAPGLLSALQTQQSPTIGPGTKLRYPVSRGRGQMKAGDEVVLRDGPGPGVLLAHGKISGPVSKHVPGNDQQWIAEVTLTRLIQPPIVTSELRQKPGLRNSHLYEKPKMLSVEISAVELESLKALAAQARHRSRRKHRPAADGHKTVPQTLPIAVGRPAPTSVRDSRARVQRALPDPLSLENQSTEFIERVKLIRASLEDEKVGPHKGKLISTTTHEPMDTNWFDLVQYATQVKKTYKRETEILRRAKQRSVEQVGNRWYQVNDELRFLRRISIDRLFLGSELARLQLRVFQRNYRLFFTWLELRAEHKAGTGAKSFHEWLLWEKARIDRAKVGKQQDAIDILHQSFRADDPNIGRSIAFAAYDWGWDDTFVRFAILFLPADRHTDAARLLALRQLIDAAIVRIPSKLSVSLRPPEVPRELEA